MLVATAAPAQSRGMALHLVKLCVGCESVEDLTASVARRATRQRARGEREAYVHVTRMTPKRASDLVDGGSLYWVIRGSIRARQALMAIEPFTDAEGIGRCRLVLAPSVVPTEWLPKRPFQGWRYLPVGDAPRDRTAATEADLPAALSAELADLGVL